MAGFKNVRMKYFWLKTKSLTIWKIDNKFKVNKFIATIFEGNTK